MTKQIEIEGEVYASEKVNAKKFAKRLIKFLKKEGMTFTGEIFDGDDSIVINNNEQSDDNSLIL